MSFLTMNDLSGLGDLQAPRPSCADCTRKHLAQAAVLMDEAIMGHPEHRYLAIGHLAEAASECALERPDLADKIRRARKAYESGQRVDMMGLIREAAP